MGIPHFKPGRDSLAMTPAGLCPPPAAFHLSSTGMRSQTRIRTLPCLITIIKFYYTIFLPFPPPLLLFFEQIFIYVNFTRRFGCCKQGNRLYSFYCLELLSAQWLAQPDLGPLDNRAQ